MDGISLIRAWDQAQSELLMKANNYNLVPLIAYENRSTVSMMVAGVGLLQRTDVESEYTSMTYIPNGYFTKEYTEATFAVDFFSESNLKSFSYRKIDPNRNNTSRGFRIVSFFFKNV